MRHPWTLCLFLAFFTVSAHADTTPVLLFPGVGDGAAAGGATPRATLVLSNPVATQQSILLEMLPPGSAVASASGTVLLAPGERREIADLHAFLAAADAVGMLRVTGPVQAKVRLRRQDGDSGWQEIPAVDPERPIAPNEEVDFPYSTPADIERDAHSNLILVNLDRRDVTVTISEGSTTTRKTIPAGAFVQIDNLGAFLGTPAGITSAKAVADGRWFGTIMTVRTLAVGQRRRAVAAPEELPSSFGLIDKALAAGTINAEQALTYKVFADFGDPRLPAAFRGNDNGMTEADSPGLVAEQWATLSPATRDLIGPYLVPAFYAGSWWDLRRAGAASVRPLAGCKPWETVEVCSILSDWIYAAGNHVRVWYDKSRPEDFPIAADLASEVDARIWPELIKVMAREPIRDHEINGTKLLDVVLTDNFDEGVIATTFPSTWTLCLQGPTYIVVNRNETDKPKRRSAFAHELFHSVQHNYYPQGCFESNYKWLMESTATWFEDELYPAVNREHAFAAAYLDHTSVAIDGTKGLDSKQVKRRNYGLYTFFFYLTRIRKPTAPDAVRFVWEATESADALHALDTGLTRAGAPLEKSWPDFALYSWNVDAPYNLYTTTDSLTDKADIQESNSVTLPQGDIAAEMGSKQDTLPHLSIRYFQFDFPDASTSSVMFYNGLQRAVDQKTVADYGTVLTAPEVSDPNSIKGAHVDALLKINGQWTHQDWTDKPFPSFCRDLKAERVDSLIIILSNSDLATTLQAQGKYAPILYATNMGCYAWTGSATLSYNEQDSVFDKMTVTDLRMEAQGDVPSDNDTPLRRKFNVVSGTFSWTVSGVSGSCGYSGALSGSMIDPLNFMFTIPYAPTGADAARGILPGVGAPWLIPRAIVQETCPDKTNQINWHAASFFLTMLPSSSYAKVSADGKSYSLDAAKLENRGLTGTWTLTSVRQ
jgi:hypothetical protein